MRIEEFRAAVRKEFGPGLEHATPANVREFLDDLRQREFHRGLDQRVELNEPKTTYEEILRDFFVRVLELPSDQSVMLLWTMAFEMSFSMLEHHLEGQFGGLFGEEADS